MGGEVDGMRMPHQDHWKLFTFQKQQLATSYHRNSKHVLETSGGMGKTSGVRGDWKEILHIFVYVFTFAWKATYGFRLFCDWTKRGTPCLTISTFTLLQF